MFEVRQPESFQQSFEMELAVFHFSDGYKIAVENTWPARFLTGFCIDSCTPSHGCYELCILNINIIGYSISTVIVVLLFGYMVRETHNRKKNKVTPLTSSKKRYRCGIIDKTLFVIGITVVLNAIWCQQGIYDRRTKGFLIDDTTTSIATWAGVVAVLFLLMLIVELTFDF